MRIWKTFFGVGVTIILSLTSCEEPERFEAGDEYILIVPEGTQDELQAFLTNESGKPLHAAYWKPGDNNRVTVYAPEGFTGKVNFHYVIRSKISVVQHQYSMRTFADVAPGTEITWQPYEPFTWYPKSHTLTVQNIPGQYSTMWQIGPTATPRSESVNAAEQTFTTPLQQGPLTYILQGNNDVTPRYLHLGDARPDESITVPFTEFLPAEKVNVTLSQQVDNVRLQVYATFSESQPQFVYTGDLENTESFTLYYYPQTVFTGFETRIELDYGSQYHIFTRYGGRVSELNLPQMNINSLEASDNTLTANVSGSYDSLLINGSTGWTIGNQEYLFSWRITLHDEALTISLPNLDKILSDHWPEFEQIPAMDFDNLVLLQTTSLGNTREEWITSKFVDGITISGK